MTDMNKDSQKISVSNLRPASGSTHSKKRVGRGCGSGLGKTCGRGHKGQKSRSGKKLRAGFEGGQMPIHRRIPKRGFRSRTAHTWLRLPTSALANLEAGEVSLSKLQESGLAATRHQHVKFYLSGEVKDKYQLVGISVTAGAQKAIEAAGGKLNNVAN